MCTKISLTLILIMAVSINTTLGDIIVYSLMGEIVPQDAFKDMSATFGPNLPYEGLRAQVVYADPPDACSPIAPPPPNSITGNWVVLVQRYNCSFEEKVRIAQNASYDGVIVHNINSTDLEPMSAKNPFGIKIPSVFVGSKTGLIIKNNYLYRNDFFVVINSEQPTNINSLLLPFAIVVGMCFLLMVTFMVVKLVKDRMRQRRHRLPSSSLNKIPTCKFFKGAPYETCAICLDDYVEGEKLRVLPCAHAYHSKCIDPWLTKNRRVCPVCKRKVFAHGEQPVPDSDSDTDTDDTTPLINPVNRNTHGTFASQIENPFRRAARSVSQVAEGDEEQVFPNEEIYVTASGEHSINTETIDDCSDGSFSISSDVTSAREVTVLPSNNDNNSQNRDLVI